MKTFISNIIPRIQQISNSLDNKSILLSANWILLDEDPSKRRIFLFEPNGTLDIFENGIELESGSWDLNNNYLKLKLKNGGYLLKFSFYDKKILALNLDNSTNFLFFINEFFFDEYLNTIERINSYLTETYILDNQEKLPIEKINGKYLRNIKLANNSFLTIHTILPIGYTKNDEVFINEKPAPNGKYKIGWMDYIIVENGKIKSL